MVFPDPLKPICATLLVQMRPQIEVTSGVLVLSPQPSLVWLILSLGDVGSSPPSSKYSALSRWNEEGGSQALKRSSWGEA